MEKLTFDGYEEATNELRSQWYDQHLARLEYERRERAAVVEAFEKHLNTESKVIPIIVVVGLFCTMLLLLFK